MMLQAATHPSSPITRYGRAIRIAYLGNLIAVHFFTLAAPVILKARHAPMGTLPLFASLALLWSLRAVIVPPLMRLLGVDDRPQQAIRVLLVTRPAIAAAFLMAAASTPFIDKVELLEALMLGAGALVCLIAGIERGFIDAAAVLTARRDTHPAAERFPVYEAAGVVIGSTLTSGLVMTLSAELGVAVCFALGGGLVALITVPALPDVVSASRSALDAPSSDVHTRAARNAANRLVPSRAYHRPGFASALMVLVLGWLGIDLAYRCVQPLMLRQGVPLRWVGVATLGTGTVLLALFGITQLVAHCRHRASRWWERLSYVVPAAAVALLCAASGSGEPYLTAAGLIALQIGYFFFSIFATDLALRYGRDAGSAEATVFLSGAAYVAAHVAVVPALYLTTACCAGFTTTCLVALALLVLCTIARSVPPPALWTTDG